MRKIWVKKEQDVVVGEFVEWDFVGDERCLETVGVVRVSGEILRFPITELRFVPVPLHYNCQANLMPGRFHEWGSAVVCGEEIVCAIVEFGNGSIELIPKSRFRETVNERQHA